MEGEKQQVDPLLQPFLQATNEDDAQRLLARLVSEQAEPIIRRIAGRKFYGQSSRAGYEAEDVRAEILVQLLARLGELKRAPNWNPIGDFRSYVAVVSYHACYKHLREKYPQRHSLKSRFRYLFTHQENMALWEGKDGQFYCGLAVWMDRNISTESGRVQRLRAGLLRPAEVGIGRRDPSQVPLANVASAILGWTEGPIELDDLVNIVAAWLGINEPSTEHGDTGDQYDALERLPDPRPGFETEVEQRVYLQRIWGEIQLLPARQRTALLLNLRDAQGGDCTSLFPIMAVATVRQIAEALAMPAEQLAELWNELPLDDARIAQRLGITRQQVINLRKSARERLWRRMKPFE
jgi:RNA polymerase sigma factor (sigma-70 family)